MVLTVNINPLKNFIFVRDFGNSIIKATDIRQRTKAGNIEPTAIDTTISPKDISRMAEEKKIENQKRKTPQDRLVDFYT